jgi:hypothetical protein
VGLETFCVVGTLLLSLLPIGALNGPVPTLTNLMLPAAIAGLLLLGSHPRRLVNLRNDPDELGMA